jgi:predicted transcriptional regulator
MLSKIFQNKDSLRIFDFLMEYSFYDYSISELSEELKIPRNIVRTSLNRLVKYDLVKKTRKIKKVWRYSLASNDITKTLSNLYTLFGISNRIKLRKEINEDYDEIIKELSSEINIGFFKHKRSKKLSKKGK